MMDSFLLSTGLFIIKCKIFIKEGHCNYWTLSWKKVLTHVSGSGCKQTRSG